MFVRSSRRLYVLPPWACLPVGSGCNNPITLGTSERPSWAACLEEGLEVTCLCTIADVEVDQMALYFFHIVHWFLLGSGASECAAAQLRAPIPFFLLAPVLPYVRPSPVHSAVSSPSSSPSEGARSPSFMLNIAILYSGRGGREAP